MSGSLFWREIGPIGVTPIYKLDSAHSCVENEWGIRASKRHLFQRFFLCSFCQSGYEAVKFKFGMPSSEKFAPLYSPKFVLLSWRPHYSQWSRLTSKTFSRQDFHRHPTVISSASAPCSSEERRILKFAMNDEGLALLIVSLSQTRTPIRYGTLASMASAGNSESTAMLPTMAGQCQFQTQNENPQGSI